MRGEEEDRRRRGGMYRLRDERRKGGMCHGEMSREEEERRGLVKWWRDGDVH